MPEEIINITIEDSNEAVNITVEETTEEINITIGENQPVKTSDLINDGENGVDPFITLQDLPPSGAVETVTGTLVDNTDPLNPVIDSQFTSDEVNAIQDANVPSATNVFATINDLPSAITIDANPTDGSTNAVSSNGVFDALALKYDEPAGLTSEYIRGDGTLNTFPTIPAAFTSPLTTKGDIFSYSTADARLGVGTDGQILSANSSAATGLSWLDNYADWTSVVKHTVKNNGSGVLNKGYAVYVTGSNGTNMLVGYASNATEATSSKTMGLLQSQLTTTGGTQTGFVITEGLLDGLNTSGATAGDPVWLGVNGALIYGLTNKPYAPAHLVFIGIVTKVSSGNGEIFVKVQNGFELKEIHDVDLVTTTPVNGHLLGYDGTLWVNKTIATWLGFTPEPAISSGTTGQYFRGDKTFQTLDKSAVGLSNVDNTSDANKPVSTAQATAIALKEDSANKSTSTGDSASSVKYPVWSAIVSYITGLGYLVASTAASTYQTLANLSTDLTASATKYPTVNAVNTGLALKQAILSYTPYKNIQTSQTAVTGTTVETIVFTATIPAGSFNSTDIIKVLFGANKTTATSTYTLRLRINTTNTITGASTIAIYSGTATAQVNVMMRNFNLNGGNLYGLAFFSSSLTDIIASGGGSGSTTLNPANIFYIFATVQLANSGDSIIGNMLSISN